MNLADQNIKNTARTALIIIGAIGLAGSALLMPNILIAADKLFNITGRRKFQNNLSNLKKRQYIEIFNDGKSTKIKITDRGRERLLKYNFDEMKIERPKKWDKKWRMVIFDIPEAKKRGRDALAGKLKRLGFYSLQKSTFIFPFDCKKEIDFVSHFFGVQDHVYYLICDNFENDEKAKKYFDLN